MELTDAGRALLAEARRTLASAAAAREAVAAVRGLLRGTLAVGTEMCLGAIDPVSLLAEFRVQHPGVQIDMMQAGSVQLLDQLRTNRLDVAFVACDDDREGVRLTEVAAEPMMLLCRADNALAGQPAPLAWEKLSDETFVDFPPDWGARRVTDAAFAGAEVRRRVAMQVGDVHSLLHLVARGLGVAVVPRPITFKEQAQGLCAVEMEGGLLWRVAVAVPASGRPGPAATALLDAVGI